MAKKNSLQTIFGNLTPTQHKKYIRYKNMMGVGDATAFAGARGDKFALSKIREKSKKYK